MAERISNGVVFAEIDAVTYWWKTYTGQQQDESREPVKNIVILHYQNPEHLISGQAFNCRCMRVENYILDGVSYEAYDCEIGYTNLIPVVVIKKIKLDQETNSATIN